MIQITLKFKDQVNGFLSKLIFSSYAGALNWGAALGKKSRSADIDMLFISHL